MSFYVFMAGFFALVILAAGTFAVTILLTRRTLARRQARNLFPNDEEARQNVEDIWFFWPGGLFQSAVVSRLYARKRKRDSTAEQA